MRNPSRSRLIAILLIVPLWCSACEVPDISEFTKQSAEMTRGIRTGVKDTGTLLNNAAERDDLYSAATRTDLRKSSKAFQESVKPTLAALDALDAYLESLNALAQANKKSGQNAAAVVNSVTGLVTTVAGLTFASTVVNVATGLITLAEQFRTTRDFRKRVTLAAEIVEGVHPVRDEKGKLVKDETGQVVYQRKCTGEAADQITVASATVKALMDPVMSGLTDEQRKALASLSPQKRREQLRDWNKLTADQFGTVTNAERTITSFGCGVIDFIEFNIADLKAINLIVSQSMLSNLRDKNRTVLGFYDSIVATDRKIQNELETILNYRMLASLIREAEATNGSLNAIRDSKIKLKEHLDNLFILDSQLRLDIRKTLEDCGPSCGEMKRYVDFVLCPTCETEILAIIDAISKGQFDTSNGKIEPLLETRLSVLSDENAKYQEELKRITPAHTAVIAELKSVSDKREQIDALMNSSLSALDAWRTSHSNLRVAINSKKQLTVSSLTSKVKEIWGIINPEKQ